MKLKKIMPGTVIHCKTESEAKALCEYGEMPNRFVEYWVKDYKENTCFLYDKDKIWSYGRLSYFEINKEQYGEIIPFSSFIIPEKTYEDGLNEAWRVLKHIQSGELSEKEIREVWGMSDIDFVNRFAEKYTPQEAIAKLETYEAEKQIKVGDVIERKGSDMIIVVCGISNKNFYGMGRDGWWGCVPFNEAIKTGKHIDISSILAKIGKE